MSNSLQLRPGTKIQGEVTLSHQVAGAGSDIGGLIPSLNGSRAFLRLAAADLGLDPIACCKAFEYLAGGRHWSGCGPEWPLERKATQPRLLKALMSGESIANMFSVIAAKLYRMGFSSRMRKIKVIP